MRKSFLKRQGVCRTFQTRAMAYAKALESMADAWKQFNTAECMMCRK